MHRFDNSFWSALDTLVGKSEIIIDRPKGTAHPKYPNFIYKVNYGYLKNTASMDDAGIDVWVGTNGKNIDAIMCLSLIHISEPTRQAEISYAVFCLKKKNTVPTIQTATSKSTFCLKKTTTNTNNTQKSRKPTTQQ